MVYAIHIPAKAGDRTPCTDLKGDGETTDIGSPDHQCVSLSPTIASSLFPSALQQLPLPPQASPMQLLVNSRG